MKLSLAMIVRDEERTVGRVLAEAATFCDELVVVDTGSRDETRSIARTQGARIYDFPWLDDFSAARNFSLQQCRSEWIVWLDADDGVEPDVQRRFAALHFESATHDVIYTPYRDALPGDGGDRGVVCYRERVIRRAAGLRWDGIVHEGITTMASRVLVRSDLPIDHHSTSERRERSKQRNLRILAAAVAQGRRTPRTLYHLAGELALQSRHREALDRWEEYLGINTLRWERYAALVHAARSSRAVGDLDRAMAYCRQAVELDTGRAEAYVEIARMHCDAERWREAMPYLRAAAGLAHPGSGFVNPAAYSWLPWQMLAICYSRLGDGPTAQDAARRAAALGAPSSLYSVG